MLPTVIGDLVGARQPRPRRAGLRVDAQQRLAEEVGVFVEPASAASVAGLLQQAERGLVPAGATIAVTVTGNGLKDTETAARESAEPIVADPDPDAIAEAAS